MMGFDLDSYSQFLFALNMGPAFAFWSVTFNPGKIVRYSFSVLRVCVNVVAEVAYSLLLDALCAVLAVWNQGVVWELYILPNHVVFFCEGAVVIAAVDAFGLAVLSSSPNRLMLDIRIEIGAAVARHLCTEVILPKMMFLMTVLTRFFMVTFLKIMLF
jgi:hypothetical protein